MEQTTNDSDRQWACEQIEKYRALHARYASLARVLQQVLEKASKQYAPLAIVQTRPKSLPSFAEKAIRKKIKYRNPLMRMTDLCGGRVITHTHAEVEAICDFIEKHFDIDRDNTVDVSQRLKPTEFGYRSVHYIIQFKRGIFPTRDIDVEVPEEVFLDADTPMKVEIQVRTLLEHAWADFGHDRVYKSEFAVPAKWQRELAGLAAMLEKADEAFAGVLEGLKTYASTYGAYMSEERMREEIEILETVLDCDPQNVQVAHRIGKLAMSLGDWKKAIEVFSKHVETGYQPILRDLGVTLCQVHAKDKESADYRSGQQYLEAACAMPNRDADALASLAGSWKETDAEKARTLYRKAFEVDPSDPYALSNYLVYEILYRRDISPVALMAPAIAAAMQRSNDQVQVGMNLPWAFYNLGMFHLLLGNPYESLNAYAKAVQVSTIDWMLETSRRLLDRLGAVKGELEGYEWVRRWLLICSAVGFASDAASQEVRQLARTSETPLAGPVVIIAGGCDASLEPQMPRYRQLLVEAFRGFAGTVISGGTTAGISGLAGDVQQAYLGQAQTIGYVPKLIPADASIDPRYSQIRKTEGADFSALEPLQYWIDLIAAGISPAQVKLLGINGGSIAGTEYRMALALGARVGVIEGSGREAASLVQDHHWGTSKLLLRLPADAMTLRAFVGSGTPKLELATRETVAKMIHENYKEDQKHKPSDPSLADWGALPNYLQDSNLQQADHIQEKLRQIGCSLHKVQGRKTTPLKFSDKEVEVLAEMEHGRWVVERLQDGWTWAKERDVTKKTSPYLVPWSELPDNVKEWDRKTVRKIPEFLPKVGLEIQRKEVGHGS